MQPNNTWLCFLQTQLHVQSACWCNQCHSPASPCQALSASVWPLCVPLLTVQNLTQTTMPLGCAGPPPFPESSPGAIERARRDKLRSCSTRAAGATDAAPANLSGCRLMPSGVPLPPSPC